MANEFIVRPLDCQTEIKESGREIEGLKSREANSYLINFNLYERDIQNDLQMRRKELWLTKML